MREDKIVERINARFAEICGAVQPLKPGPCYWLESDSSESFCRQHAIAARGKEFDLGAPIEDRPFYLRTEMEDAFFEGISCNDGCGGESDHAEACAVCGKTLVYTLTDEGVDQEVDFYREAPLCEVRDEDVYAIERLVVHIWPGAARGRILDVAIVVNQAWRLLFKREATHA